MSRMDQKVCLATPDDIADCVRINIDGDEDYRPTNERLFAELIPQHRVMVCKENGSIIALLYWREEFLGRTDYYFLEQITTRDDRRSKGFGSLLLDSFLNLCKEREVHGVFGLIHNNNTASLRMCLKAKGFISGMITGFGEGDRVIVRFDLDER